MMMMIAQKYIYFFNFDSFIDAFHNADTLHKYVFTNWHDYYIQIYSNINYVYIATNPSTMILKQLL